MYKTFKPYRYSLKKKMAEYPVQDFVKNDVLAKFDKEVWGKKLAPSPEMKTYTDFEDGVQYMSGWVRLEWYILNPKSHQKYALFPGYYNPCTPIGEMYAQGHALQKEIIEIILHHPDLPAQDVLLNAPEWLEKVKAWRTEAEKRVPAMLNSNQPAYQAYRQLQKLGVFWPHSSQLRTKIEKAGFVYTPMIIKRDRCECSTYGVKVAGWRPWHNPEDFHDRSKHPAPAVAAKP